MKAKHTLIRIGKSHRLNKRLFDYKANNLYNIYNVTFLRRSAYMLNKLWALLHIEHKEEATQLRHIWNDVWYRLHAWLRNNTLLHMQSIDMRAIYRYMLHILVPIYNIGVIRHNLVCLSKYVFTWLQRRCLIFRAHNMKIEMRAFNLHKTHKYVDNVILKKKRNARSTYTFYERCIMAINRIAYEGNFSFIRKIKKSTTRIGDYLTTYMWANNEYNKFLRRRRGWIAKRFSRGTRRFTAYKTKGNISVVRKKRLHTVSSMQSFFTLLRNTVINTSGSSYSLQKSYNKVHTKNKTVDATDLLRASSSVKCTPNMLVDKQYKRAYMRKHRPVMLVDKQYKRAYMRNRYLLDKRRSRMLVAKHSTYAASIHASTLHNSNTVRSANARYFLHNTCFVSHIKKHDLQFAGRAYIRTAACIAPLLLRAQAVQMASNINKPLSVRPFLYSNMYSLSNNKKSRFLQHACRSLLRMYARRFLYVRNNINSLRYISKELFMRVKMSAKYWRKRVKLRNRRFSLRRTLQYFSRSRRRYQQKWYHV
jgi:hypothetical protein